MTQRQPIIIDTDPGQDDAIAILLALASPEPRIVLALANRRDVPVYAGADRPLLRPLVTAEFVHGKTGLDGPVLPEPTMPMATGHAVDFIIQTVMAREPGTVTLCPLGPLTNIALALAREPQIAPRLKQIVLMGGGGFEGGNITPVAEFNFFVDPHAAAQVFKAGVPITMAPLDVTHQALTTRKRVAALRHIGNHLGETVAQWMEFFERFDEQKYGQEGGPLHDPCVIAWLLKPELFTGRDCFVQIECQSEMTMGQSVIDWWGVTGQTANARVLGGIDADGFYALITERLSTL